jgi:hypothetical protein
MAICGLIGRLAYNNLSMEIFYVWIEQVWVPVLGYLPEVIFLTKGWIGIIFAILEDAELLLSRKWVNKNNSLMLKRLRLAFNPQTEYFSVRNIWVMLPGIPLYLWNEGALTAIRNNLGNFIMVDKNNLESKNRKIAKILVEMDVHLGMSVTMEVEWRGLCHQKRLDYLGLPFRCSYC